MKNLFLAFSILFSLPTMAGDYTVYISNVSKMEVSFGKFKGIRVPTLGEDGWEWDEIFVKFRPLSRELSDIRGTVEVVLNQEELDGGVFLMMKGREFKKQIEFVSCDAVGGNDDIGYPYSGPVLHIEAGARHAYCLSEGVTDLVVK